MSTARQIADQIQRGIESGRTPCGGLVGTEPELRAHYGVSLATLRQAVRILEQRQVAAMRRGASGGLYAEQASVDATANAIAALWERTDAARTAMSHDVPALDALALRRASERMSLADAAMIAELHALCSAADDPIARSTLAARREHAIAQMTGNPVIVLGLAATLRFLRSIIPFEVLARDDPGFARRMHGLINEKIAALVAGEVDGAVQASAAYSHAYLARLQNGAELSFGQDWPEAASRSGSLPTLVSRAVLRDIRKGGWQAGAFLGQEADLMRRYNVGRNSWRQALSILIEYSAGESRRGGGGGIYVAPINSQRVMDAAGAWLSRQGVRAADGLEVIAAIAPHHAAAIYIADAAEGGVGGSPVSAGGFLDSVLVRQVSPLLALGALVLPPEMAPGFPSADLSPYCCTPSGAALVKRAVRDHIRALG